ncbi:DUF1549 and DUF1553 domain-containing protein [Rubripirellula reticaptiva]|uniref:Cytochrome c domain-containing protein n=1 Tax=Rubripirellula reticaptiva TaxID=2528013 RepID=A0A5C6EL14_9BACT|nr:DUF1549 and DUF1553 domain-containing protein [Rubripirellula reticaptiva]TWU47959.1 hypothetical protein Poly59_48030 [Rubripirellula reticaptiva]
MPFPQSHSRRTNTVSAIKIIAIVIVSVATASLTTAPLMAQSGGKKPAAKKAPKINLPASVRDRTPLKMQVAAVNASSRSSVASSADRLDSLVEDKLRSEKVTPNPIASDEIFLRRVYLDVAGRIPTLTEATEFLSSTDPEKREVLIDGLLSSPDYVSNFYNFWADVLRLVERPTTNNVADPYLGYVKDTIRTNKKYDAWVYEMLTADGKVWNNPATGFQLRDDGMPLPYIDNTVRVFLGTQIGCAQCHDHPFDQWSQYQFFQLAAFTAGTRTRLRKGDPGFESGNPAAKLISEAKTKYDKGKVPGPFQRLAQANMYSVSEVPAKLRLPHDYAYEDAKPKQVVEPEVLWGKIPSSAAKASPREQFAAWLTSPDNPQFSRTIANRLWKRFLGVGLVDPIDDFRDENQCVNEPLLDFLSHEVIRNDFDLKEFMRTVLYSKTYQREATDYELTSGTPYYFQGPVLRRMTAEQVWDSILTLAVANPWPFQRPTAEEMAPIMEVNFEKANYDSFKRQSEKFGETYFRNHYNRTLNQHAYQGNILARASELPSPVAADHFLRQFGQGDRETINCSQTDATVPQILAMFNGPITHVMLEEGSSIVDQVLAIENTRDRIDAIFLSLLARYPNPTDRKAAAQELGRSRQDGVSYGNIIWALLNTREFLFVQ